MKKKRENFMPGGDLLTWALLLGIGGFAVYKGVEEYKEREDAKAGKAATTAAPCGCTGAK